LNPGALRYLHLVGAVGAEIRTAQFDGRAHVVVPVVALVGGAVVHAANAVNPELVPAEAIEASTPGWNGEPVVSDHPSIDGRFVSANAPGVLDHNSFGRVFNARFEDNRLKLDAYLDPERAAKVGPDAVRAIERCRAGEPVEVSVGAYVLVEPRAGESGGVKYEGFWSDILPDHLALLPEGATGACSQSMGCGAPRVARHLITAEGLSLADEPAPEVATATAQSTKVRDKPPPPTSQAKESKMAKAAKLEVTDARRSRRATLLSRVEPDALEILRFRAAADESVSDGDLRGMLERALWADEPAFLGIDAVFSGESLVVYAVAPEQQVALYRRGYTLDEGGGGVTLAADKEQVEPVTNYQPVTAAEAATQEPKQPVAATCGCHDKKEIAMSKLAERVTALIQKGKFAEADRPWLMQVPEERFAALESVPGGEPKEPTQPETPKTPPEEPDGGEGDGTVTLPADEVQALRSMAAAYQAEQKVRVNDLVTALKGKQDAYTETELRAMSVSQLERIAKLVKLAAPPKKDFSGRVAGTVEEDGVPPPPDMAAVVRDLRKSQSAQA
jgi:hypothetical protein